MDALIVQLLTLLKPVFEAYAGNFGWALQVIAIVGTLRLFVKPIIAAVEAAIKESASKKDDVILEKVQANGIYKVLLFLLDLFASIKPLPKEVPVVSQKK
jgi:hypothetical protein